MAIPIFLKSDKNCFEIQTEAHGDQFPNCHEASKFFSHKQMTLYFWLLYFMVKYYIRLVKDVVLKGRINCANDLNSRNLFPSWWTIMDWHYILFERSTKTSRCLYWYDKRRWSSCKRNSFIHNIILLQNSILLFRFMLTHLQNSTCI